jgi:hypothetical protein
LTSNLIASTATTEINGAPLTYIDLITDEASLVFLTTIYSNFIGN